MGKYNLGDVKYGLKYTSTPEAYTKTKWNKDNQAKFSDPKGKVPPKMEIDYNNLKFKHIPDKTKLGIWFDQRNLPKDSIPPQKKKYDAKGRYTKEKYFVETKKKEKKTAKYSLNGLMRESSPSNPKNQDMRAYGRKK